MHWNNTNITEIVTPYGIDTWLHDVYEKGSFFNVSATLDDPLQGYVVAKMVKSGPNAPKYEVDAETMTTSKYPASGDKRARAIGWKNLFPKNGKFLGAEQNCFWQILYIKRPGQSGHFNENIQSFTEPGKRISGCVLCLVPIAWDNSSCFLGMSPGGIIPDYYRHTDNKKFLEVEVGDILSAQKMYRLSCPRGCLGSFKESLGTLHLCFYGKDSSVPEQVLSDDLNFDGIKITDLPEIEKINDNHKFLVYYRSRDSLIPENIGHIFSPNLKTVFFDQSIKVIDTPPYSLTGDEKYMGLLTLYNKYWSWDWDSGRSWVEKQASKVNSLEWFFIRGFEKKINQQLIGIEDKYASKIKGYIISIKTKLTSDTYNINSNVDHDDKEKRRDYSWSVKDSLPIFILHDNKSSETTYDIYGVKKWYELQELIDRAPLNSEESVLKLNAELIGYDPDIPFTQKIVFSQFSKDTTPSSMIDIFLAKRKLGTIRTDLSCSSGQFILGPENGTTTTLKMAFMRPNYDKAMNRKFLIDFYCDGYITEK